MNHRITPQVSAAITQSPTATLEILSLLTSQGIAFQAYAIHDQDDCHELSITTNEPAEVARVLEASGLQVRIDSVIAFEASESKGRLARLAQALMRAFIKVDYICPATNTAGDTSSIVMKVSNLPLASRILTEAA